MLTFNNFLYETQFLQPQQQLSTMTNKILPSINDQDPKNFIHQTKNQMTRKHNYFYKPQQSGISSALLPKY